MKAKLDYIESRLQALIENTVKLFNREPADHPLAHQLVAAMRDSVILARNGKILAPDVYTILVCPADLAAWQANVGLQDSLAQILVEAAQESGVIFVNRNNIVWVRPDDEAPRQDAEDGLTLDIEAADGS